MMAEKIRELRDDEMDLQRRELQEQVWKLRFQASTGQTEGVKKLRLLRKDIARIETVRRERERSKSQ